MGSSELILDRALRACGQVGAIESCTLLSKSGLQKVHRISLYDGSARVVKSLPRTEPDRLEAEADGLKALALSGKLIIPGCRDLVVVDQRCYLVMDEIKFAREYDEKTWGAFGRSLAEHHQSCTQTEYGWHRDNYIGETPQPNLRCDDWVRFNAEQRLGFQLSLAWQRGLLKESDKEQVLSVIERLDSLIPRRPSPALLHGDLWSGNALPTSVNGSARIAVIDPAVHVGDGWADIAMMKLFGGFPQACFDAYYEAIDDREHIEQRVLVYQLYHMLNHLNIFGRSYREPVISIISKLQSF